MPRPPAAATRARRGARLLGVATVAALVLGSTLPAHAAQKPKQVLNMPPGEMTVYKVGNDPAVFPEDIRAGVIATLTGYLTAATVKPLRKGKANDAEVATAFAPAVAARLTGPDRGVLVDEGLPKSKSKIVVNSAPIALSALADGDGRVIVVTANLDATTTTKTTKGKINIKRAGELVFTPTDGAWKISGYTLAVDRAGKGLGATTTTTTVPAAPASAGAAK